MNATADATAKIQFFPTSKGGLKRELHVAYLSCPLMLEGDDKTKYDCRIMLDAAVHPGDEVTAQLVMLSQEAAKQLTPGLRFRLWQGRFIGEGVIRTVGPAVASNSKQRFARST